MVALKSFLTLGILAALAIVVIQFRKPIGETGLYLGQGLSSLGSSLGVAGAGLGGGIANLISLPAKGLADAIASITSVVRTVPPVKTLAQGGIPFTSDIPFGGIEFGPESPKFGDVSIPTVDNTVVTPANREMSDDPCVIQPGGFDKYSGKSYRGGIDLCASRGRTPSISEIMGLGKQGIAVAKYTAPAQGGFVTGSRVVVPSLPVGSIMQLAERTTGSAKGGIINVTPASYQKLRERGLVK